MGVLGNIITITICKTMRKIFVVRNDDAMLRFALRSLTQTIRLSVLVCFLISGDACQVLNSRLKTIAGLCSHKGWFDSTRIRNFEIKNYMEGPGFLETRHLSPK